MIEQLRKKPTYYLSEQPTNPLLLFRASQCNLQLLHHIIVPPESLQLCFVSFCSIFLFAVVLGCSALDLTGAPC